MKKFLAEYWWFIAVPLVIALGAVIANAEPTQQQVDEVRQSSRDMRDHAKALKDSSDDPAIKTLARIVERIGDVAVTAGVELDRLINTPPDEPAVTPPDDGSGEAGPGEVTTQAPDWWTYEDTHGVPCPQWIITAPPRERVTWDEIKDQFVSGTPDNKTIIRDKTIVGGVQRRGLDIPSNIILENVEMVEQWTDSFALDPKDGTGTGWELRRCIIRFRAFDPKQRLNGEGKPTYYGHGAYIGNTDIIIDQCAILDGGWWVKDVDGQTIYSAWVENHGVYLSLPDLVKITRTLILNPASQGVKMKGCPDLLVEDCTIIGGIRGLGGDDRFNTGNLTIRGNLIADQGRIDSAGRAGAIGINLSFPSDKPGRITGQVLIEDNIIRGPAAGITYDSPRYPLAILGVTADARVTLRNNIIDWPDDLPASISVPADQLTLENNTGL